MSTYWCKIIDMSGMFSAEDFAQWLTSAYEKSIFKSWRSIAAEIGTSHSTLSRLAGAKSQTLTMKPSQPKPELVIRLATLFGKDVNEALMVAGHAPLSSLDEEEWFYRDFNNLPAEKKKLARRQVKAIINALAADADPDTNYIDD